ncbi:hypothetical protein LGM85_26665 [Burkholderia multivorans]|nr:hypothetical protein [Burkholderia multivorans]
MQYDGDIEKISLADADAIIERYRKNFLETGISKYPQKSGAGHDLPGPYVFFPLQVQNDPVSELSSLTALDLLPRAAELARENRTYLVLKRHPFCQSLAVEVMIDRLCRENPYVRLTDDSIHRLIPCARSVLTVNSGVGLEALIHGASVYSTGASEWYRATHQIHDIDEVDRIFHEHQSGMNVFQRKFIAYLLSEYWVNSEDFASIDKKINECIAEFDADHGIVGEQIRSAEILLPVILDLQGRLDYEMRRAKLLAMDFDALRQDRELRILEDGRRNSEIERLLRENKKLQAAGRESADVGREVRDKNRVLNEENRRLKLDQEALERRIANLDQQMEKERQQLQLEIESLRKEISESGRYLKDWLRISRNVLKRLIGG